MNLYAIKMETNTVVYAETPEKALRIALDERSQMIDVDDIKLMRQIVTFEDLPPGWDANCIPWGQDKDEDISQILDSPLFKKVRDLEKERDLLDTALKNTLERLEMLEAQMKMLNP